jgi:hypothetical protein
MNSAHSVMMAVLPQNVHSWHHVEFALYIAALMLMLYLPPRALRGLAGVQQFIEAHFGDSVGLYLLHLGIALVILAGVWPNMPPRRRRCSLSRCRLRIFALVSVN